MANWIDLEPGRFPTPTDFNDADNNEASTTVFPSGSITETLGAVRWQIDSEGGSGLRALRFVQLHADSAAVATGTPVMWKDTTMTIVTTVISSSRNHPAGVGIGTLTAGRYGWIQCKGYHAAVITDGGDDIAKGDSVIYSATDAKVDSVAAGTSPTYKPLGFAAAADVDADNTVAVYLDLL